jgi:hypothetical protein
MPYSALTCHINCFLQLAPIPDTQRGKLRLTSRFTFHAAYRLPPLKIVFVLPNLPAQKRMQHFVNIIFLLVIHNHLPHHSMLYYICSWLRIGKGPSKQLIFTDLSNGQITGSFSNQILRVNIATSLHTLDSLTGFQSVSLCYNLLQEIIKCASVIWKSVVCCQSISVALNMVHNRSFSKDIDQIWR